MAEMAREPVRVPDGILDPERWWEARTRILWLLREVNNPTQDWDGLLPELRRWSVKMHRNGTPTWSV